jgi:hypothetical protein
LLGRDPGVGQGIDDADALDVGAPVAALGRGGDEAQLDQVPEALGGHARAAGQFGGGQLLHDRHGRPVTPAARR